MVEKKTTFLQLHYYHLPVVFNFYRALTDEQVYEVSFEEITSLMTMVEPRLEVRQR